MIMLLMRKVVRVIIRVVVLIMLLLLLLPGKLAYGQSTPEPTNTPYSPYNTPVPPGAPGSVCPAGTPLPTPLSMQYYDLCGHCIDSSLDDWLITPIPFGTLLPYGTGTPGVVTATPAFTPTPTQEVYVYGDTGLTWIGENQFQSEHQYAEQLTGQSGYLHWGMKVKYLLPATNHQVRLTGSVMVNTQGMINPRYTRTAFTMSISGSGSTNLEIYCKFGCNVQGLSSDSIVFFDYQDNTPRPFDHLLIFDYVWYPDVNDEISIHFGGYGASTSTMNSVYEYSRDNSSYFIGTPTPVPDPGYCSVYDYQDDGTLVDYPGIIIRQGECIVVIPDFAINLPAVGENIPAVEWGIQGFSICPKWVDLGEIKVAEFEIPVDIVALPALVFIMWLIFVF